MQCIQANDSQEATMRISTLFPALLAAVAVLVVWTTVLPGTSHAKPRPATTPMTIPDSIAACKVARHGNENSIDCIITSVQGHPTLAVEFVNEQSMSAYLDAFQEQVADPFCKAANQKHEQAFFVVALKTPRMGSVSWCETGKSSGWVSLDSL
jgi:hypothetical protein